MQCLHYFIFLSIFDHLLIFFASSPHCFQEPAGLAYLFAVDWLLDRFRTVVNLTGDLTVTGIVSSKVSDDQAEQLGDLVDGSGTKDV